METTRRHGPTLRLLRRPRPGLRSLLERLDDLEASDLFADLDVDIAR